MDFSRELGNSIDLQASGGRAEVYRDEDTGAIIARPQQVRLGATGFDLAPPLRTPMNQAEGQTFEETKQDIIPTAVGLASGATAATLGTLQDIGGFIYGAGKAMTAEEGERLETFLTTAQEVSDKYGSGAVRGFVMDKAREAGLDDRQMETLEQAFTVGEFGGIGGLVKGAVTKGPQMLSKTGDLIEGAGDAAKARMAEGGVTLNSGVDPDPAIAAVGDAVAKFRAPTEKEPGVIAFHGSGADFDEFSLEKIGTGEGAQAYGYGLYFTDSEDIAKFYRDAVSEQSVKLDYDGNEDAAKALQGNAPAMFEDGYKTYVFGDAEDVIYDALTVQRGGAPSESYLNNQVMAFDMDGVLSIDMPDGTSVSLLKTFSGDRFTATPISSKKSGKMYKVALEPKPEDMLDYQGTFADQPKNVQDALKAIGYEVETDRAGLKNPPMKVSAAMNMPMPVVLQNMKKVVSDAEKAPFDTEIVKINDRMNVLAKTMDQYEVSYRKYSDPKGQEAADEYDSLMDKRQELVNQMAGTERSDKLLARKLSEQGVPGIKYRAAGSRGANVDSASAEYNYVIFDDKMIKILEKYGIVGPVAIGSIAASKQGSEQDAGA